jgi:hypothetical protein
VPNLKQKLNNNQIIQLTISVYKSQLLYIRTAMQCIHEYVNNANLREYVNNTNSREHGQ